MGAVFYVAYNLFFYLLSPHFPPYSTFFYPCLCPLLFLPLANLSYVLFSSSRLQREDKRSSLSGARQRRGSWNYGLRKWRRRSRFSRLASRLCRQTMTSPMRGSLPCRVQTHARAHVNSCGITQTWTLNPIIWLRKSKLDPKM